MMNAASLEVSVLHSDLDGPQRDETMRRFRDSETRGTCCATVYVLMYTVVQMDSL